MLFHFPFDRRLPAALTPASVVMRVTFICSRCEPFTRSFDSQEDREDIPKWKTFVCCFIAGRMTGNPEVNGRDLLFFVLFVLLVFFLLITDHNHPPE